MSEQRSDVSSKVEAEHRELNQQMGELDQSARSTVGPKNFLDWKKEFLGQLQYFRNRLQRHFEYEEYGGFMEEVLTAAPQSQREVKELKLEHARMIANVDEVLARLANAAMGDSTAINDIRASVDAIIASLRLHENAEHTLIQRAYYREFGGEE